MLRRFYCWFFGHTMPVITGRLRTHEGDWKTMTCYDCQAHWHEPIHKHTVSL